MVNSLLSMTDVENPLDHQQFLFFSFIMQNVYFFIQLFDSELTSLLKENLTILVSPTLSGSKNCLSPSVMTFGFTETLHFEHTFAC